MNEQEPIVISRVERPGIDLSETPVLAPLVELAYDLTWVWTPATQALFERIDRDAWLLSEHNPVRVLASASPDRLAELAGDEAFLRDMRAQHAALRAGPNAGKWFARHGSKLDSSWRAFGVAYFCAEFGLHESFQIYSGGLGLLAGDHVRSAAQMGLPFVGVGLLYRHGYFRQHLDAHGMQHEQHPEIDRRHQPIRKVIDNRTGHPLTVQVDLPGRRVSMWVWRVDVGAARLYLLDTNHHDNEPHDRRITDNLYLGDQVRRIEQEIVLGIGGVRALEAAHEYATVYHMNEGHAAFMGLERIRQFINAYPKLSFDQAREAAAPSHVFTTHTPVPAGIDRFNPDLVRHYFEDYAPQLGLDLEGFMALGRELVERREEAFSMAVMALRISKWANGVSNLHGEVSRKMWKPIWPDTPESDVPIGHVTNGVHTDFWVGPRLSSLFDKALSADWRERPEDPAVWSGVEKIADGELWAARNAARSDLVAYCSRMMAAGKTGGITAKFDPHALTIGFARRFAGYKRATLILRDTERLSKLLAGGSDGQRPVQLIISGKAHPGDNWGKILIREIVEFARSKAAHARVLFIEDYSIEVARHLVRGCDVWLNNPIRGLEASGTSGMKAAMNGVLNVSTLDGWWDEGFAPDLGYKIDSVGTFTTDAPSEEREDAEARNLYKVLEREVVPEFFDRGAGGVPSKWLAKMKRCIATLSPRFTTHRMIAEYAQKYYFPAHAAATTLARDPAAGAAVADKIERYRTMWRSTAVRSVRVAKRERSRVRIEAAAALGGLQPSEVAVQAVIGELGETGRIEHARVVDLETTSASGAEGGEAITFAQDIAPGDAGANAWEGQYAQVRIIPRDHRLVTPFIPGLVRVGDVVRL